MLFMVYTISFPSQSLKFALVVVPLVLCDVFFALFLETDSILSKLLHIFFLPSIPTILHKLTYILFNSSLILAIQIIMIRLFFDL